MKIKISTEDINIPKEEIVQISEQIEKFISESNLEKGSKNLSGINLYLNSELVNNSNAIEVFPKVYRIFDNENIEISNDVWRLFFLKCLHIKISEKIKNIVLVFSNDNLSNIKDVSNQKEKYIKNTKDIEDEPTSSYLAIYPKYNISQVIMSGSTKKQIERAISLIRNQKKIFIDWGFSEIDPNTKTILCFYGSPGTGKTMCAHALAKELNKKILIASYATIESKWVGEGPKNLQRIFKDAEEQDALLFFDEADSFLSKRVNNAETGSDKHYNRMSNEMFQLLEDYNGIVVFATNLVSDFDKAFKSRILAFVEFKKPDFESRKILIKKLIPSRLPIDTNFSEENIIELCNLSEGFCGRDIRKAILTTLAEGAVNNTNLFSIKEFSAGFMAVKEDIESIDASINSENSHSDYISDFIQYNKENNSLISICQKVINQFDDINESVKLYFNKICKILNMDLPDLSVSYRTKNILDDITLLKSVNRIEECALYCSELIARATNQNDINISILESILLELDIKNKELYQNYIKALTSILYQNK